MKVAVIRYPGSNCDQDAFHALNDDMGMAAEYVWHDETSLAGFDAVFIPGGFSYGDYLRCGAMASRSPIMDEVKLYAQEGKPVIGACNGFQILCEAGLLPGALLLNAQQKFVCETVTLKAEGNSPWTQNVNRLLRIPIAHGEGRFICDNLEDLEASGQVAFRYVDTRGTATPESNLNGSMANIAGITNKAGNVLGLMPHPERATRSILGSVDGLAILKGIQTANLARV